MFFFQLHFLSEEDKNPFAPSTVQSKFPFPASRLTVHEGGKCYDMQLPSEYMTRGWKEGERQGEKEFNAYQIGARTCFLPSRSYLRNFCRNKFSCIGGCRKRWISRFPRPKSINRTELSVSLSEWQCCIQQS